jgi:hypothetical protein
MISNSGKLVGETPQKITFAKLAARGIGYPYRGTKLGNLLIVHLGALGENIYTLYRFSLARHLRDGIPGRVRPTLARGTYEVIYPDLSHVRSSSFAPRLAVT